MIIAKYETEIGFVYGKISLFNFLACLADANKHWLEKRFFVLRPISGFPWYKDYKYLLAPQEKVILSVAGKNDIKSYLTNSQNLL